MYKLEGVLNMAMILQSCGGISHRNTSPHPRQDQFCCERLGEKHLCATAAFRSHKNIVKSEDMIKKVNLYCFLQSFSSLSFLRIEEEGHVRMNIRWGRKKAMILFDFLFFSN